MYQRCKDRKGRKFDQLVMQQKHYSHLLCLAHGSSWSGHLDIDETKRRLFQEYYWSGCYRDAENVARSFDACQRVGKPHERTKAALRYVILITGPFSHTVMDIVDPLPKIQSGYKCVLTMLCPATKFPEAVPLKELTSIEIMNALLSVFLCMEFPAEIHNDGGSVFTNAFTTTFL